MNYFICLLIICYINFLAAMSDQQEQTLRKLQQEAAIPVFALPEEYQALIAQQANASQCAESAQKHAKLIFSGIGTQLPINQLDPLAQQTRKQTQSLTELAHTYGFLITLNGSAGQELIKAWPTWSSKAPDLAVQVEQYLSSDYMLSVIDQIANLLPTGIEETNTDTSHANKLIDDYVSIFTILLNKKEITKQDTEFIIRSAIKFLHRDDIKIVRCPSAQQHWLDFGFSQILNTLKSSPKGLEILAKIRKKDVTIDQTLSDIEFIEQLSAN